MAPQSSISTVTTSSPFLRHLSFFDVTNTGSITFGDALRGSLSLGLNFPVSVVAAIGLHTLYGNAGILGLTRIDVAQVRSQRTMLEGFALRRDSYTRADLMKVSKTMGWLDWMHVMSLWSLAADAQGRVHKADVASFQRGELLEDLKKRRKDRSDVLPFLRGGPFSVSGHSWLVGKLFNVYVYRDSKRHD